jgi:hypothetical protein
MYAQDRAHDREIMMKQAFGNQGTEARQVASGLLPWLLTGVLGTAALLAGGSLAAAEVYTWTDENGVLHYSDTPRTDGPMETIEAEEAYRPGSADAYPAPVASEEAQAAPEASPSATESAEAPQSAADARREELASRREERREAKAETDRLCAQHRQRVEQMEPSRRVFTTGEDGEPVRMDDEERVALVAESKAFIDKNCQD